jgi:hypothetical protein
MTRKYFLRALLANGELDKESFLLYCSYTQSTLISVSCGQSVEAQDPKSSLQCTRLLLQAGADPTSSYWHSELDARTGKHIELCPFPPLLYCLKVDTLVGQVFTTSVIADTS